MPEVVCAAGFFSLSRALTVVPCFVVIEAMGFRQHALMQDAGDEDATSFFAIEHDMASGLQST